MQKDLVERSAQKSDDQRDNKVNGLFEWFLATLEYLFRQCLIKNQQPIPKEHSLERNLVTLFK